MTPQTENWLRAIIRTQTEIASADLDAKAIMQLIADRARDLTSASAGVIELAEGDEMVYAVTRARRRPISVPGWCSRRASQGCAFARAGCCEAMTPARTRASTPRLAGG